MWKNSNSGYGWVAIVFHWLTFLAVAGLFGLGLYMVDLGYYDPFYHQGPWIHKSIGLILCGIILLRLIWKLFNKGPRPLSQSIWINRIAETVHWLLYLLLLAIILSGYFISSANGDPVAIFDWVFIPGIQLNIENQEDLAGEIHEILVWVLVGIVALHAAAALKHHFYDRDDTLKRIFKPKA